MVEAYAAAEAWAAEFSSRCEQRIADKIAARGISEPTGNRASGIGEPCERALYYDRVEWRQKPPPPSTLQSIFMEGNLHEDDVVSLMRELKMPLQREQVQENWKGPQITGKPEGVVEWQGQYILAEIKSVGHVWDKLKTADDLRNGTQYVAKWFAQVQIYMLLVNIEACVILLKSKQTGQIKAIAIALDYEYAEGIVAKAERVNAAVAAQTIPDFYAEVSHCQKCQWFGKVCQPPSASGSGAVVITDESLVELSGIWLQTKNAAKAHKLADDMLKANANAPLVLCGDVMITSKTFKTTKYKIPDEVKQPYAEKVDQTNKTIQENPLHKSATKTVMDESEGTP